MPAPISFSRPDVRRPSYSAYGSLSGSYGSFMPSSFGAFIPSASLFADEDEDMEDGCLPRLEADFCKDFSCCGLVLDDLHDLLQHYEDQHCKMDEDLLTTAHHNMAQSQQAPTGRPKYDMDAMKRQAILDMQYHLGKSDARKSAIDDDEVAFDCYSPVSDPFQSRKRSWRPSMSSPSVAPRDFFTPSQSPRSTPMSSVPSTPVHTVAQEFSGEADHQLLFGPPANSDDWVLTDGTPRVQQQQQHQQQQQVKKPRTLSITQEYGKQETVQPRAPQVIEHPGSNLVVVEKPYKCPVPGCDKAYKNQNGLKYHKSRCNCAANPIAYAAAQANGQTMSYMVQENKPHSCPLCAKRYKNLNGLKYHTNHSHQHVTTDSNLRAIQEAGNNNNNNNNSNASTISLW